MRELDRNRRKPVRKDGLNVIHFQILFKRTKAFGGEMVNTKERLHKIDGVGD